MFSDDSTFTLEGAQVHCPRPDPLSREDHSGTDDPAALTSGESALNFTITRAVSASAVVGALRPRLR